MYAFGESQQTSVPGTNDQLDNILSTLTKNYQPNIIGPILRQLGDLAFKGNIPLSRVTTIVELLKGPNYLSMTTGKNYTTT